MKAAIDMMPRKLPGGEASHTGSWAFLRANQLRHVGITADVLCEKDRQPWSAYDVVYLFHTMDFDPHHPYMLNIFDGPQEHTAKFFERLIFPEHAHLKFISLDYPMPNYGYRCQWKKDRASADAKMSDYWRNVDWGAVQTKCDSITDWVLDPGVERQADGTLKHLHPKLTMGDSHAHSAYAPKSLILRKDGRTMRGIVKKTLEREVNGYGFDFNQVKELTCYYGNIDIRHHLCREPDPIQATRDLVASYAAELQRYPDKAIEVVCPLPIEDETRPLPTTGYYKGTPFYGTRAQRQEVLHVFTEELRGHAAKHGWGVFRWPDSWYTMDGVEFFKFMEVPRSVHLARKYYRWDLVNDQPNPLLVNAPRLLEF